MNLIVICNCGHKPHVGRCNRGRAGGWGKSRKIVYCGCQEYVPNYKRLIRKFYPFLNSWSLKQEKKMVVDIEKLILKRKLQ